MIVGCGFSVGLRRTGVSFAFQSLVADDGHKRGIRFDHAFAADALLDVVHADAGSDGFEEVPRGLGHDVAATDALRLVVGHEVEEHVLLDGVSVVVDDFQGEGVPEGIGSLLFKSLDVVVVGAEHQVGLFSAVEFPQFIVGPELGGRELEGIHAEGDKVVQIGGERTAAGGSGEEVCASGTDQVSKFFNGDFVAFQMGERHGVEEIPVVLQGHFEWVLSQQVFHDEHALGEFLRGMPFEQDFRFHL